MLSVPLLQPSGSDDRLSALGAALATNFVAAYTQASVNALPASTVARGRDVV
jgi:hypothetical protein